MSEDNKYPNLNPPEGPMGDLKEIKHLPGMNNAHQISWGDEYKSWPIERRLEYAEKLASSMNHAADILQKERDELIKVAVAAEAKLKSNIKSYVSQGELMHKELGAADAEKQVLYQEIVSLKSQVKDLTRRLADKGNKCQ
jgi:hypothetical protein